LYVVILGIISFISVYVATETYQKDLTNVTPEKA
jgi:hypothetical protein